MKLVIDRNDLAVALGRVIPFATGEGKGTNPALSGIKVVLADGVLTLNTANDLGQARAAIKITDPAAADGECLMLAKLLAKTVRNMPEGELALAYQDQALSIQGYGSTLTLRALAVDDFPRSAFQLGAGVVPLHSVEIGGRSLARAITSTAPAASTQQSRPILMGVHLDAEDGDLRLVATDIYRLNVYDIADAPWRIESRRGPTLSARALRSVASVISDTVDSAEGGADIDVSVSMTGAYVWFSMPGVVQYALRRIEGDYPGYRNVMAPGKASLRQQVIADRKELAAAVRRATGIAGDIFPLRLEVADESIEVVTNALDRGSSHESLGGLFEVAKPLTVSINCKYFADALRLAGGERVVLDLPVNSFGPVWVRAEDEGADTFVQLVMPVRV